MTRGLKQAFLIGITAGMRCFLAPAIVVSNQSSCSSTVKIATAIAAVGELVADKTPYIGSRLDAGPLAARVAAGSICGAKVTSENKGSAPLGFLVGGIAALASAQFFYHLRRAATESGVPDVAFALSEDAVAFAIGSAACSID